MKLGNPTTDLIATIALSWIKNKPFSPEAKARRKAARKQHREQRMASKEDRTHVLTTEDGNQITKVDPIIPARVSSKISVGAGLVGAYPAVEVLQAIQNLTLEPAWLEALTNSDYFVYLGAVAISAVIARFTKTPLQPGAV